MSKITDLIDSILKTEKKLNIAGTLNAEGTSDKETTVGPLYDS